MDTIEFERMRCLDFGLENSLENKAGINVSVCVVVVVVVWGYMCVSAM